MWVKKYIYKKHHKRNGKSFIFQFIFFNCFEFFSTHKKKSFCGKNRKTFFSNFVSPGSFCNKRMSESLGVCQFYNFHCLFVFVAVKLRWVCGSKKVKGIECFIYLYHTPHKISRLKRGDTKLDDCTLDDSNRSVRERGRWEIFHNLRCHVYAFNNKFKL